MKYMNIMSKFMLLIMTHELSHELVAGDARLETFILYFLSLYHNDLAQSSQKGVCCAPSGTGLEGSAFFSNSFHLIECRTALASLLLLSNLSEGRNNHLRLNKHMLYEVKSSLTLCSLEISCTRTRFQKSFDRLTVKFYWLSTNLRLLSSFFQTIQL